VSDKGKPKVEEPAPEPEPNPEPDPTPPLPEENDGDVTTQPSISTEEASQTDVELSPVGDEEVEVRAEWDTAYINDLPDSAFACIDSGGEKEDGKTVPRSLRHYPHHNSSGAVDLPHLRNALSRVAQDDTTTCGVSHLRAHAEAEGVGETRFEIDSADIEVRSVAKREIEVRLLPWDTVIETNQGPEMVTRGAMADTAQDGVLLMGLEHEAHIGVGSGGRPVLTRHPAGRSVSVWEADDGPHVAFRVARTQAGDELLALAEDKVIRHVSAEFFEVPGGTSLINRSGRRVRVHNRVRLTGASMTYRPAYGEQAAVLAVRSQEVSSMAD
jgi:phage head maturation protease